MKWYNNRAMLISNDLSRYVGLISFDHYDMVFEHFKKFFIQL